MSQDKHKPFLGEASVDTRALVEVMRQVKPGEMISYGQLNDACGRDVQDRRHITDSARRILERDYSMVFRCIKNEGFIRLTNEKIVDVATTDRREKMRRQAGKAIKELACVAYEELLQPKQIEHNTNMALFGSMYQATSKQSVKKLQERVANAGGEIDLKGTLKLIGWMS